MLRHTQFVDTLLSRCGKRTALSRSLKVFSVLDRKAISREAKEANSYLKYLSAETFLKLKPSDLNKAIFLNACVGNFDEVLTIAKRIARDPAKQRLLSAELYMLLLELISALKDASKTSLAIQLCHELSGMADDQEVTRGLFLVMDCARKSSDFTQLVPLRILFDSLLLRVIEDHVEFRYLGTVISVLLNSNQYLGATEHFQLSLKSYPSWDQHKKLYSNLPITKLIDAMCAAEDCHSLMVLLRGASRDPSIIKLQDWLKSLSSGLLLNDYRLVKLIYDVIITNNIDGKITVDDVIFDNKLNRLEKQNTIFGSLSDSTISEILRTFASHGDVTLCMSLIELHYVHKTLKGKKSLSKEIFIDIVRAYCFHESGDSPIMQGESDDSVKNVIDVMHNFLDMQNGQFTYRDVSDAFLQKMYTFRVFDKNVEDSAHRENIKLQRIQDSLEDETVLPRKTLSAQVTSSKQGNVFMNTDILKGFVQDHSMYILDKGYGEATMSLFLNCVLDYVQKFQNFSGAITILEAVHELNKLYASEWLNTDLYDLLSRCLATSSAAMAVGFKLYLHLKGKNYVFTPKVMENYIYSSLRNPEETSLLEFYVHEYLSLTNGSCSTLLSLRLSDIASKSESFRQVAEFLANLRGLEDWREAWASKSFVCKASQVLPEYIINSRYSEIDLRDLIRLDRIIA